MRTVSGVFGEIKEQLVAALLDHGEDVDVGEWQAIRDPSHPMSRTRELRNVTLEMPVPTKEEILRRLIKPTSPWAEDHFRERVSGTPHNPPPSASYWAPGGDDDVDEHRTVMEGNELRYSHTYPERFWPRFAGLGEPDRDCVTEGNGDCVARHCRLHSDGLYGIRFRYGDLSDVVTQIKVQPYTRQAYLPVWFPEDTGGAHGERVPCSLGYHFLVREPFMWCTYYIRSCDLLRHLHNDVYLAARLLQWMVAKTDLPGISPGALTMHVVSLHVFRDDLPALRATRVS